MSSSPVYYDRVRETTTTSGTGTVTLAGAFSGYQSFAVVGNGNSCYYCIADQSGSNWEVGIGTYTTAGTTLSRDVVLASSNSGAAVAFGSNTKDVFVTQPAAVSLPDVSLCNGRLTLTSGTAVTSTDVTGATTVYWTPYQGNRIALWNGSGWQVVSFAETSLALGTLTSGLPYDVFAYLNAGVLALEMLAWSNGTTRATALTTQDGVLVKTGAVTRRYLGTFYTTGTTTTEDSVLKRNVWNYYHRQRRPFKRFESTTSWTYGSSTWRQANASASNQVEAVVGVAEIAMHIVVQCLYSNPLAGDGAAVGVGTDSTTTLDTSVLGCENLTQNNSQVTNLIAEMDVLPALGHHVWAWIENSILANTTTFFGGVDSGKRAAGMVGWIEG